MQVKEDATVNTTLVRIKGMDLRPLIPSSVHVLTKKRWRTEDKRAKVDDERRGLEARLAETAMGKIRARMTNERAIPQIPPRVAFALFLPWVTSRLCRNGEQFALFWQLSLR